MIFDNIENIKSYKGHSKWLDVAIDFLIETDLKKLPIGRTEIFEDKVFANVIETMALDQSEVEFEIHKKYMDIQIDIEGIELIQIGLNPEKEIKPYDRDTDLGTVTCRESASCIMGPGRFIVCMAQEPHKPSMAAVKDRHLKKCVLKVAVQ